MDAKGGIYDPSLAIFLAAAPILRNKEPSVWLRHTQYIHTVPTTNTVTNFASFQHHNITVLSHPSGQFQSFSIHPIAIFNMRNKIPIPSFSSGVSRTRSKTKKVCNDNDNDTSKSNNRSRKRKSPTATNMDQQQHQQQQQHRDKHQTQMGASTIMSANTSKIQCPPPLPQCPPQDENRNCNHDDTVTNTSNKPAAASSDTDTTGTGTGTSATKNLSTSYLSLLRNIDTVIELQMRRSHSQSKTTLSARTSGTNTGTDSGPTLTDKAYSVSITLDKFINLISKATDANSYGATTKTMMQDLVIVYLITASPELVQVQYDNTNANDNASSQKMKIVFPDIHIHNNSKSSNAKINRLELLSKLYKTKWKGWNTEPVQKLKEQITHERTLKETRVRTRSRTRTAMTAMTVNNQNASASTTEAILTPGMTLEQRIHARSKARLAQEQTIIGKQGQGQNNNSIHLLFADALNIHFRHASKRQRYHTKHGLNLKSKSAQERRNQTFVTATALRPMSLNEVCAHLSGVSGARAGGGSSGGLVGQGGVKSFGHGNAGKTFRKKEVKKILYELADMAPEWIQIVSGKSARGNSNSREKEGRGKKNLMVVIKGGVSYQMVREKLNGRVVRARPTSRTNMKLEMADSQDHDDGGEETKESSLKEETLSSIATAISPASKQSISRSTIDSSLESGDADTGVDADADVRRKRRSTSDFVQIVEKQPQRSKLSQTKNRNRPFGTPITIPKMPSVYQSLALEYNRDQDVASDSSRITVAGADNELRVNYNQHMTDADYDGGLVLQSNSTNPRGLKRMFSQLNAGERI